MTQDEIIEMAKEASLTVTYIGDPIGLSYAQIAHFAKLVAAKERAEFAAHAIDIIRRAVQEEREACAKVCEDASKPHDGEIHSDAQWAGLVLATTIRARGEA